MQCEDSDSDKEDEIPEEVVREVKNFENKPKSNLDETKIVNLGDVGTVKETRISIHLSPTEKEEYTHFLKEYEYILACSYDDMIGLITSIVAHKLLTNPMCPPVKQKLRKFKPDMSLKIKEEVTKQIKAKVLKVVEYPTWLANIVQVPKNVGKVKMLRKYGETSWTEDCQSAFDKIKEYLSTPPIIVPPEPVRPLPLYLSVLDGVFGCVLGQHDETWRKEQAIYYLSTRRVGHQEFHDIAISALCTGIQKEPTYCVHVEEETDGKPWFHDINEYLAKREYLEHANHTQKRTLWRLSNHFFNSEGDLYRRTPDLGLLRCVEAKESSKLLEDIHDGTCGPHMNDFALAKKILRTSYFWMTIETDWIQYVRKCYQCQVHADMIKVPPNELNATSSPWPFVAWGMDVIGPIGPTASNYHMFMLVAIDYFTKWAEATS
ncbi:uncharacterized protein [Nicotiana sylvestris]|uniref:uncharacterized protein n=1 Tax=Nicotiana sylvestris TaxID=4096 RepID=UPI00388CBF89